MKGFAKTMFLMVINMAFGFYIGYTRDRPLEIEATKPIVFTFEVTAEAARAMTLKGVEGMPTNEEQEAN